MSPEQVSGKDLDPRSDIFAFGVVLYELLAGRRPFVGETALDVMHAILHNSPPPLPAQLPVELRLIVEKALEKDRGERYQSMRELAIDLKRLDRLAPTDGRRGPARPRSSTIGWWLGAMLTAALLWWALLYLMRPGGWQNPLAGAQIARLTDFEGIETDAALSPDGKFVAFLANRNGPIDAWVGGSDGAVFANLTGGRFPGLLVPGIRSVGFTGDGSQVWLRIEQDLGGKAVPQGTFVMSVMGGVPRRFLESGVEPYWSPDGTKLVYHESGPGDPIFIADRNGANPKRLFNEKPGAHCHHLTWSRDGRFIYFVRGLPLERADIWRVAAAGGEPEQITDHNSNVGFPVLPDARTLLYTATAEDGSGPWLYGMDLQERVPHRVSIGVERYLSLSGSSDGLRLVATVANPNGHLWTVPILERPATDANAQTFPLGGVRTTSPRFAPDYVLYLASKGGAHGIWKIERGAATELWRSIDGGVSAPAAPSPDGRLLCFSFVKDGRGGLYAITSHGTGLREVGVDRTLDVRGSASWSPDGKWIAFTAYEGETRRLFKVPVEGGSPVALVSGQPTDPVWSPDGLQILYRQRQGPFFTLKAITPDGRPVVLPDIRIGVGAVDGYRFIPGSRALVVLRGDAPSQNFWLVDLDTGRERQLTDLTPGLRIQSFDVSRDARQILFDRWRDDSDIVLIERAKR
jgi:Tol biopolymer transport system component